MGAHPRLAGSVDSDCDRPAPQVPPGPLEETPPLKPLSSSYLLSTASPSLPLLYRWEDRSAM